MAKSSLRIKARQLRSQGKSVKTIANKIGVAKSTASLWVRDIILSLDQLEELRQQHFKGSEKGRLMGAFKQKQGRLNRIQEGIVKGQQTFKELTGKELLIAGTALYWAEGTKRNGIVSFCNSDPKLVQFMITWLRKCFDIPIQRFNCYVGINEIHAKRESEVKQYWSRLIGVSLDQFTKTSFKIVKNKKVYENFDSHFGTLTVKVRKPAQLYFDILGLIEGLYQASMAG